VTALQPKFSSFSDESSPFVKYKASIDYPCGPFKHTLS